MIRKETFFCQFHLLIYLYRKKKNNKTCKTKYSEGGNNTRIGREDVDSYMEVGDTQKNISISEQSNRGK